jgi:hypothetical protein
MFDSTNHISDRIPIEICRLPIHIKPTMSEPAQTITDGPTKHSSWEWSVGRFGMNIIMEIHITIFCRVVSCFDISYQCELGFIRIATVRFVLRV